MRRLALCILLLAMTAGAAAGVWGQDAQARVQELRRRLESLRVQYTDQHPDVIMLRRELERWEARAKQEELTRDRRRLAPGEDLSNQAE
jgi:hypothetical protein